MNKENESKIFSLLKKDLASAATSEYKKLNLKFNPFPRAGIANVNNSNINLNLFPVNTKIEQKVTDFIRRTILAESNNKDKYLGLTILGDYGTGKTQLLMFIKAILDSLSNAEKIPQRPFVLYIDNPGTTLSELISSIIYEIGHENLKKYIWNHVLNLLTKQLGQTEFNKKFKVIPDMFKDSNPWHEDHINSYKTFLNACYKSYGSAIQSNKFKNDFFDFVINLLVAKHRDPYICKKLMDLLDEDLGMYKTWASVSLKGTRSIEKREVGFIKTIMHLLKDNGFTHIYILVDEFEDITVGRLKKSQADNYLYNLRTLIDQEREWAIVFAMIPEALDKIEELSPPLANRITTMTIEISKLTNKEAVDLVANYLHFARLIEDNSKLFPFTEESIETLNEHFNSNPRILLSRLFQIIEDVKRISKDKLPIEKKNILKLIQ